MRLTANNLDTHYELFGEGEPVLFVHGFPLSGEMWRLAAEDLADRWLSIVPDLRGHGKTAVTESATISAYADDLAALLDQLREWRPVVLVGLSMGGIIGFEFFRRYRNRLRALVLCDTRYNAESPEGIARREAMAQAVLKDGSRIAAEQMGAQLFSPGTAPQVRDHWNEVMGRTPPLGVAAAARALATRPDSTPTLSRIDCPTLIIYGQDDTVTPVSIGEELRRSIRGARLELIPNAGHMPPVEQPILFNRILRNFLESL